MTRNMLVRIAGAAGILLAAAGLSFGQSTNLLNVYGALTGPGGSGPVPAGYALTVKNLTTGASLVYAVGAGGETSYEVAFVAYQNNTAASVGDAIEVILRDTDGQVVSAVAPVLLEVPHVQGHLLRVDVAVRGAKIWSIFADGSGDAPTIQAGIDTAVAALGDTVLIMPGTFTWTNQAPTGTALVEMKNGISVRGYGIAMVPLLDAEGHGPVIRCEYVASSTTLQGLGIRGGNAGGIYCRYSDVEIRQCLLYGNSGTNGGGIFLNNSDPLIVSCTIVENEATGSGSGVYCSKSSPTIQNTIIGFNFGAAGIGCGSSSGPAVGCCDLYGNAGGDALPPCANDLGQNFSLDPLFCAPEERDYRLQEGSPCENGPRGELRVCGLVGAFGIGCPQSGIDDAEDGRSLRLAMPRPNPFSARTAIWYALPAGTRAVLSVHDVNGRLVTTLASGMLPSGNGVVRWDGTDSSGNRVASGVYFLRLETEAGDVRTARTVLMR